MIFIFFFVALCMFSQAFMVNTYLSEENNKFRALRKTTRYICLHLDLTDDTWTEAAEEPIILRSPPWGREGRQTRLAD